MKIIVPMAGRGTRLRPATLVTPKPLIHVAGKPMVQRIVEDITRICDEKVDEIAYIIGPTFGKDVEKELVAVAEKLGAKGSIYYQETALGTAHAIYCAEPSLTGKVVIAFADTLFKADFVLDSEKEGIIWVNRIDDPRQFGVVKLNDAGVITDFVEKPPVFVSDLAIIGIYYFKDGDNLKKEIKYLLDNGIQEKGEYQLTNALENMKCKGVQFVPGAVTEWLDCGNKDATVYTNARVLEFDKDKKLIADSLENEGSVIVPPCFIGENVKLKNSVVGPHVSLGDGCVVENTVISNSIIQKGTKLKNANLTNSMVGIHAEYNGNTKELSLSDYSVEK